MHVNECESGKGLMLELRRGCLLFKIIVKGVVHPKKKILSSVTHRHVVPKPVRLSSSEHKWTDF